MSIDYDELVHMATEVGSRLLQNGAEIYRVEESIQRIFQAYGVIDGDVFAIASCIISTVRMEDGHPRTKLKRVYDHVTNLEKIKLLNSLCRDICANRPDFAAVYAQLEVIEAAPCYPRYLQVLAVAFISFSFTLFYRGTLADAVCAIFCGLAVKVVCLNMERVRANPFFTNLIGSAIATGFALFFVYLGWGQNLDKITIGTLMNLVPGVALTNCMRDIIAGDLIAGLTKLTEALLIGTAIALGAGAAIAISRALLGGIIL